MVRAGHDFVVKVGIQEAFEARQAIRTAVRGQRGVHKIAPVVIDGGKIAENFAGGEHKAGSQFVRANFEAKILRFAAADGALGFRWHGVKAAAFFVFVDLAAKKLGQRVGEFRAAKKRNDFGLGQRGRFLEGARGDTVLNVRFRAGKGRERKFQDVAALMRKVYPAVCRGRHGPDRMNPVVFALEADDAEGRAHACDFGNEQLGQEALPTDLRRGFTGFRRGETRWRISTASPCSRQKAASSSATRRRWHFSGPGSEQRRDTLEDHEDMSTLVGTSRSFIAARNSVS